MMLTARRTRAAPKIGVLAVDVLLDSSLWKTSKEVESTVRRAVAAAANVLSTGDAALAIVLADDSTVRQLNRAWRGVDAATNVLSFPTKRAGGDPPHIGDIVLAYETVAAEARAEGKPFAHHLAHLVVHGFLHLLGYDHARSNDAQTMERLERDVLRRLAIPDPYRRRVKSQARRPRTTSGALNIRRDNGSIPDAQRTDRGRT
jgi:probable rRNA maturation factor